MYTAYVKSQLDGIYQSDKLTKMRFNMECIWKLNLCFNISIQLKISIP